MAADMTAQVLDGMKRPDDIRNIGIAAHIDHGKTTFSDNLLAGAGMISQELAGKQRALDFDEEEAERGITIYSANVSMVHEVQGKPHLINLIDTPGHVDFGGEVTRAMRAVDGVVVLACAVEGCMPQTETVLRQALKERVKPVLFINKVDRLIKELQLTPEQMQERFVKIIANVNKMIRAYSPEEFKEKWQVSVQDGSVAFGSAYQNWALSVDYMKKKGVSFKDVYDFYQKDDMKGLLKAAPLHEPVLNMVVDHLPAPIDAQKYRIPKLWHGDIESEAGKSLLEGNPNGPLVFVVTKVVIDPQAGEIAYGRVFSGTLKKGSEVKLINAETSARTQQIVLAKGGSRLVVDSIPAGNIAGIVGLKAAHAGETVTTADIEGFEAISHLFEPVVSKAIEAKNPQDLPKLIEVLRQLSKEDPTLKITINQETGENIIAGLGELHLEIKEHLITREKGIDIVTSDPIVVYRETVEKESPKVVGKSPNRHNHLHVIVEPMTDQMFDAINNGDVPELKVRKKNLKEVVAALTTAGMDRNIAKKVKEIYNGNMFIDGTRGIVYINEIIELVLESFREVMNGGPYGKEPCGKMIVTLKDAKLHEDSIHRGPAQIIPAMRNSIYNAMLTAGTILYEPIQTMRIDAPIEYLGAVSKLVQSNRGQLVDTEQGDGVLVITARVPVAESFGFTGALRESTSGRGAWFLVDQNFEPLPRELQNGVVAKIRQRKGMKAELPVPELD
jgi:elongation factor 2